MRSHQRLLGVFLRILWNHTMVPSPRQNVGDLGNPEHSLAAPQPSLHSLSPARAGLSPWQLPGGDRSRTLVAPSTGDRISVCRSEHKPRGGSLEGIQQKAERQMGRAGRQLSVSLAHTQEFFLLLSQMSSIF